MPTIDDFKNAPVDARAVSPSGKQTYRKTAAADGVEWLQETDGNPEWASSGSLVVAGYRLDPGSLWRNNLVFDAPAPTTAREALWLAWNLAHPVKEGQLIPAGTDFLVSRNGERPATMRASLGLFASKADETNLRTLDPLPEPEPDWLDAVKAGDSDAVAQERAWAAIGRKKPNQIESAEKHDVKSALEDFKRRFGRKN